MEKQMNQKFALVPVFAILMIVMLGAFAIASSPVSNFNVEIDGVDANGNNAVVAGDIVPITIDFTANENASEVQVSAWIQGHRSDRSEKDFADLIDGSKYRARLSVEIPLN